MDNEMLNLMTKLYAEMQKGFNRVDERFNQVNQRMDQVNQRIDELEKIVLKIEKEHGEKLSALFDGYKQNSDKLDRIEAEVSTHEEIILRRIR
ncbi:hypothetical protein [Thermoanaerobacterium sp. DL9XJH110]|uniref:hypothetical protein n=1 Tax=Thermoanaerobacterium sp. DL9XJH110 TaxID=3386643 RepID=UPI003BB5339A